MGFFYDSQAGAWLPPIFCPGAEETYFNALNNLGQVVGYSHRQTDSGRAFLWEAGGWIDLTDVTSLPKAITIVNAYDINDSGQILACCYIMTSGQPVPYLGVLTPVPEPSSILSLIFGLGGVGGIAFRKRR
jgi:probable HAF family extracellular repeat protein